MRIWIAVFCLCEAYAAFAQEAASGFELSGALGTTAEYSRLLSSPPRDGEPFAGGFRLMLYPTWKLSEHWAVSGAVQVHSRPYFHEEFSTQGYGVKADILQANLSYARYWTNRSFTVRVGQLSSAFGSFLLRYDDSRNPLIDMPLSYGYYGKGVTNYGLAGAQVDGTFGKVDLRAQFVNSSPANRRGIFDRDQYGNWAGGAGYTIWQGFRVGVSAYRGPYLNRGAKHYFPGEAKPKDLPATGYGLDVQWGRGPWTAYGELQRFQFAYRVIPTFDQKTGYGELRRVITPRLYLAARAGFLTSNSGRSRQVVEVAAGIRPNRYQLLKLGYEVVQGYEIRGSQANAIGVQLVTTFKPISVSRD